MMKLFNKKTAPTSAVFSFFIYQLMGAGHKSSIHITADTRERTERGINDSIRTEDNNEPDDTPKNCFPTLFSFC
jgi:hypothetical protein